MELFNLSFLNSFCCNSLVHLMVDTKQKHWKQYIDLNVIQSFVYMSLRFNFFRLHNLLDFDTAIMRFAFPYHAFTWQCGIARSLSSLSLSLSLATIFLSHTHRGYSLINLKINLPNGHILLFDLPLYTWFSKPSPSSLSLSHPKSWAAYLIKECDKMHTNFKYNKWWNC